MAGDVERNWKDVHFGPLSVESQEGQLIFEVQVYLGGLDPGAVRVELYADALPYGEPVRQAMDRGRQLAGAANAYAYSASVPASRDAKDFTPRVVAYHPDASVPLEADEILWQR